MCWMVLSCSAIDDGARRQECFQSAYDGFRSAVDADSDTAGEVGAPDVAGDDVAGDSEPSEPVVTVDTARERRTPAVTDNAARRAQTPVVTADTVSEELVPVTPAAVSKALPPPGKPVDRPQPVSVPDQIKIHTEVIQAMPRRRPSFFQTRKQETILEIPKQFTGEVTLHRKLVRDRHLLVVDNALLFEGDRADASRLKVGDRVDVQRSSRLSSDRFEIAGPTGRSFSAMRVRCESQELNETNQRKCTLLPEQTTLDQN